MKEPLFVKGFLNWKKKMHITACKRLADKSFYLYGYVYTRVLAFMFWWLLRSERLLNGAWVLTMHCIFAVAVRVWLDPLLGEVSISLRLPEGIPQVDQNGCLSAMAGLKWGYDGDISGHVCENTITSMSRLNHSPLYSDSPRPLTSSVDLLYMS